MAFALPVRGVRSDRWLPGLVAVLTLMTLELVRSSGPLLDVAYSQGGVPAIARDALLVYLAPGPLAALLMAAARWSRLQGSSGLLIGVVLLAALRVVVQALQGPARFTLGLATVATGITVLTLAVAALAGRESGGRQAAGAVSAGAAAGVGLQLALGTWDALWRHTLLGWSVTVAMVIGLLWLGLGTVRSGPSTSLGHPRRLWVLGPFLALAAMSLANPAFAASQSSAPLALAGPVHALGLLGATWLVTGSQWGADGGLRQGLPSPSPLALVGSTSLLAVLVWGTYRLEGTSSVRAAWVLLVLVGAQIVAVRALGLALDVGSGQDQRSRGTIPIAALLVGLLTVLPMLAYQVDYEVPLGFPNELVLVATAAALGLGGIGAAGQSEPHRHCRHWPLLAVAAVLVLLGTGVAAASWAVRVADGEHRAAVDRSTGRVLSWNVHYGVSPTGSVDLESTARLIEAQDPDVVLLQEVSRGWVLGGGVDMATWLADRLDRRFVFAAAADGQFGNAILSRSEPTDVSVQSLPYGAGPQARSAVTAQVTVAGRPLRATAVHLQNGADKTETRRLELQTLLAAMAADGGGNPARLIGSDLNATPGSAELGLLDQAGFVSAVDTAGDPNALTFPSEDPSRRIDWLLGRGIAFGEARVLAARTSDHLPVVATLRPD